MKRCLVFLVVACGGSIIEISRGQTAGGSISGVVNDPSGASVPRARVLVRSLATHSARALTTNLGGFYTAPNLVPGDYEVTVSAGGFETRVAPLTMRVGAEQELNFTLRVGSVEQKLEVAGPASGIELASSELAPWSTAKQSRSCRSTGEAGPTWRH